eukprot:903704-Pyramimonas_sp.AAC.1
MEKQYGLDAELGITPHGAEPSAAVNTAKVREYTLGEKALRAPTSGDRSTPIRCGFTSLILLSSRVYKYFLSNCKAVDSTRCICGGSTYESVDLWGVQRGENPSAPLADPIPQPVLAPVKGAALPALAPNGGSALPALKPVGGAALPALAPVTSAPKDPGEYTASSIPKFTLSKTSRIHTI